MSNRSPFALVAGTALLLSGCASHGPVVPVPPAVRVTQLDSIFISPEVVKFQAKIVIQNRMGAGLKIQKVDWGADVQDHPAFTEAFTDLHPMKRHGQQTVTFPFQISMKDIMGQAVHVLADEALRVSFRGQVFPVGFEPVPFEGSRTIPLPRLPLVTVEGAEGYPLQGVFTVYLGIRNPNRFPLGLRSVDSYLELNGNRYGLLRTHGPNDIAPGGSQRIALTMQQTIGKTLSMALSLAQTRTAPQFGVGGSITCQTPHGLVHVPLELSSQPAGS